MPDQPVMEVRLRGHDDLSRCPVGMKRFPIKEKRLPTALHVMVVSTLSTDATWNEAALYQRDISRTSRFPI